MPPKSRWQRFRLSRWYPVFWLFIFLILFLALTGSYYYKAILNPNLPNDRTANQAPSTSLSNIYKVQINSTKNSIIATDDQSKGNEYEIRLVQSSGESYLPDGEVIITLSSSSQTGKYSSGNSVTIPRQQSSVKVLYADTKAGTATLTALASGTVPVTSTVLVKPAEAALLSPIQIISGGNKNTVPADQDVTFVTTLTDIYENPIPGGTVNWVQVGSNNLREVSSNDVGMAYFVAHFDRSLQPYSAIVRAQFSSKQQSIYLTVQP